MYVRTGNPGKRRMAGAHRLSGLRGAQRIVLGQDDDSGFDWDTFTQTLIKTAGSVAAVAVKPPTYSSSINPYTGQQTITSYAPTGYTGSALGAGVLGTGFSSLLSSPLVLLGGAALLAVVLLKR